MKSVLLDSNPLKDEGYRIAGEVAARLSSLGMTVYVVEGELPPPASSVPCQSPPPDTDLILVIGGDGTVLDMAPTAMALDVPICGINLGRLGYLATVETGNLSVLGRLASGEYEIRERTMLSLAIDGAGGLRTCDRPAVNDVVICREDNFGIAEFRLSDNCGNAVSYRADGVIVATSAGSSAYSLSAGGPLVDASVETICVTPICPHSFFNRSILFNPAAVICVKNTSTRAQSMFIWVDGRPFGPLLPDETARLTLHPKRLKMLAFTPDCMLNTLRRKMDAADIIKPE
ncbi:MAG: NAD(+)/NADH kinase [Eubacteriales bacterium]